MTLEDLIKRAASERITPECVRAFQQGTGQSLADFYNSFARRIHLGYTRGEYSWEFADAAINRLSAYQMENYEIEMPPYAWEVYLAFDAGEFQGDVSLAGAPYEVVTKQLLADANRF